MSKKTIVPILIVAGLILSGCSGLQSVKPPGYGEPPIITASFCVDKGMYGDPIKIYLAAEDPHGDMDRVAVQVSQTGTYVFVVRDGAAYVQPVKVARVLGSESVLSGELKGGEVVVTNGQLQLSNGTKIAVREPKAGS